MRPPGRRGKLVALAVALLGIAITMTAGVVCAARVKGKAGASWISDEFRVYDATSGKLLDTLDLSTAPIAR